jgi:hypothetical protein
MVLVDGDVGILQGCGFHRGFGLVEDGPVVRHCRQGFPIVGCVNGRLVFYDLLVLCDIRIGRYA